MSQDKIFRVDWYAADAYVDFSRMDAHEIAVMIQIINLIYLNQGAIENEPKWIARSIRDMGSAKCRNIINKLIEKNALFLQNDGKISQKRTQNELKTVEKRKQNASKTGKKGAENRWRNEEKQTLSNGEGISSAMASTSTSTSTSKERPPLPPAGGMAVEKQFKLPNGDFESFDGLFERFWKAYPNIRNKGHKSKAKEQFKNMLKKGESYERIGRGITKYRRYCENEGQKNSDMFRWIRDKGWENNYEIPTKTSAYGGRGVGYSLEATHNQALDDKTRQPAGRKDRLKNLGID